MKRQQVVYWYSVIRWYFNDKQHRDGLPTSYYFDNEKLDVVYYRQHNKLHRTTGPAIVNYKHKTKEYWYQDREYGNLEEILMIEACR